MANGNGAPPGVFPSWWLARALEREGADGGSPPLAGDVRADVCVVGGGYTGLWTALELKAADPGLGVVVLEAEICGFGASGRNGGFAMSWWNDFDALVHHYGAEQAVRVAAASSDAIDRIERFAAEEEVDVHFTRGGLVWVSAAEAQDGVGASALAAARAAGEPDRMREMTGAEARERLGSPLLRDGVYEPRCASVQPALLARGLRRVALRRGVRIHEHTRMTRFERDRAVVHTPRGSVTADRVVLATNAWLAALPELRTSIMPISSAIVLTAPIPERIERMGWTGGELLSDGRLMVHYTHVTGDGRIAFGRGGGPLGVAGRLRGAMDWQASLMATVADDFRRFFPSLADVPLEASWGGTVDRAAWHMPFYAPIDDAGRIFVGAGYSGNGVAPSVVGGQVLAGLVLGQRTPLTESVLVGLPSRAFPPEPLRSVGGAIVRGAVGRSERLGEIGRPVDPVSRAVASLVTVTLPRRRRGGR